MSHAKLILIRHGESEWNKLNKFTGWVDCDLSDKGVEEANQAGEQIRKEGIAFTVAFTSVLKRAIKTLWTVLERSDQCWIPVHRSWRLNERHYGALQGLNKAETVERHGKEQVLLWRRSFDIPPPPLADDSDMLPSKDVKYQTMNADDLPRSECLKDTIARTLPYWNAEIVPHLQRGETVLVVAHGNSIRGIVKHLDGVSDADIPSLEIPTGIPLYYELDQNLHPVAVENAVAPLSGKFLGDPEVVAAAQEKVRNQIAKK